MREDTLPEHTTGYRLIAGESDGLPGITIDIYANWIVCQLLSAGAELQRGLIVESLRAEFPNHSIYERSDVDVRKKEGLTPVTGLLHGTEQPPAELVIEENGLKLYVDIVNGHKTGYYLDQRDARQAIKKYAKGKRVLNCFSYTGGFGLYAASAGARYVRNLDMSQPALDMAAKNLQLNNLTSSHVEHVQGDVLLTFSCSGLLSTELFQKVVADGVLDAGRDMQIIERTFQAADHPVFLPYPEGLYLKGLIVRLMN